MPADILTVTELNRQARLLLEQRFPLLWVSGEISNLTRAASGHVYFSLKDSQSQVRCVMFRSRAQILPWQLENGQQVEAQALVTLYEARGDFQLNVEGMRRSGVGRLYELFVRLREKLADEGLFDAARKRELPRFPRRIGIVTSPQAAALQDVIATLARRAPHVELIVYPTLVQGAAAPAAIVAALQTAARRNECDVLLIVRGGGSIEDLWAFNDEAVARAIVAQSAAHYATPPAPTICGIGHETDITIADYVPDRRAASPTAAAELASAGWFAAAHELAGLAKSLRHAVQLQIESRMQAVDRLALRLLHPAKRLAANRQRLELLARRMHTAGRLTAQREVLTDLQLRLARARPALQPAHQRLDRLAGRLRQAMQGLTAVRRDRLTHCNSALAALSPAATLLRGYSITQDAAGRVVRDAAQLAAGDTLQLQFAVGGATAVVDLVK
ncbi:MAG: exodeoxyribonuclease VII large subunit, partial [Rhodocyclaceae bacterium]|nr:exodeoxyribonuclease VII large subunit [Rhodocyclaceae bacterium]